ncbi:MAG: DUF4296 domain-containing protein [Clostridium sp.]|nr:DUF4296 domain-containing protein [Clostridium sp.]
MNKPKVPQLSLRSLLCVGIVRVIALLSLSACNPEMPSEVISPSRMESLLFDYHLAQAMAEESYDSVEERRYLYVQAALRKHGVSEAEFDSSMVWYSAHADYLTEIYRRLSARYDAEVKARGTGSSESELFASMATQGDTANIWSGRSFYVLRPNRIENKMAFTMKADTAFRRGDTFIWHFTPHFVCKEGGRVGFASIMVRYTDGTTSSKYRRVEGDWKVKMELSAATDKDISELYGFVYFPTTEVKVYRMLTLAELALVRCHPKQVVPEEKDETVMRDTLSVDSVSGETDARRADTTVARRLTPSELRRTQEGDHTIEVVKDRPYVAPKKTSGHRQRAHG